VGTSYKWAIDQAANFRIIEKGKYHFKWLVEFSIEHDIYLLKNLREFIEI